MAQGITFTTDWRGNAKVTIDLKRYGYKLMDFFRSEGIEDKAEKRMSQRPNAATRRAIGAAQKGKTIKYNSFDEFEKHLYEL